ncbi:MAG: hypothetical protein ACI802_000037 [Candidatus Paceibacteria bacterium]|jgi:hypothetical protein
MSFFKRLVIMTALLTILLFGNAQATEYIVNGTFNDNASTITNSQTGWTTTSNFRYFENNSYFEGDTTQAGGTLSQNVIGAIGIAILSFDYSANAGYQSAIWNGAILNTVNAPSDLQHYSFNVTATGNDMLTFLGQNLPAYNRLSNVSLTAGVTAVPEPETYAMMIAGLALMGFVARRKSNKKTVI